MKSARSRPALTELKKRSDYLCALAVSLSWRKRFGAGGDRMLRVAMDEDRSTTALANRIARSHGWEPDYDPWGGDRNRGTVWSVSPRANSARGTRDRPSCRRRCSATASAGTPSDAHAAASCAWVRARSAAATRYELPERWRSAGASSIFPDAPPE